MWAAINHDNLECTLFIEERDALLYVAFKIASYYGYSYEFRRVLGGLLGGPARPLRKLDNATLAAFVLHHEGDDKSWFITETCMGEVDEGEEEEEENE